MPRRFQRLRWQLTISHLIAIVSTLICMIAAVALIVTVLMGRGDDVQPGPVQDARTVARAVGGLVLQGDTATLSPVLHALVSRGLELDASGWSFGSSGHRPPWVEQPLHDVTAITILGLDGTV